MIIKDERQSTRFFIAAKKHLSKVGRTQNLIAVLFVGLGLVIGMPNLVSYLSSESRERHENSELKRRAMNQIIEKSELFGPVYLDIKQKSWNKLEYARKNALKKGYITDEEKDLEVPGLLRLENSELPVSLRFKGDLTDHIKGDQWSYRIKVKDSKFFRGVREFSIHHPKARNYLAEYLFNLANKQENILTHRYDFLVVVVNNQAPKLYAIEEHFTKQLIENAERREGPILKFDESIWWKVRNNWDYVGSYKDPAGVGDYFSLEIDAFSLAKLKEDPVKYKQYVDAYTLLSAFRNGEKKAEEVFVTKSMAKFLALSDLFGAYHGLAINQARFYFNPILARLEPIPFDANAGDNLSVPIGVGDKTIFNLINIRDLFKDRAFFSEYIRALNEVSQPKWLKEFKSRHEEDISKREALLQGFYAEYVPPWAQFSKNSKRIREFLEPLKVFHAHKRVIDDNNSNLVVANLHSLPIEVLSIEIGNRVHTFEPPLYLEQRHPDEGLDYHELNIGEGMTVLSNGYSEIKINARIVGMDQSIKEAIDLQDLDATRSVNPMRLKGNIQDFPFIKVDKKEAVLTIKKGTSILSSTLVIPEGFKVSIDAGASLLFRNRAHLISYSPIIAKGTTSEPIKFSGAASNAKQQGGIVVANTNQNTSVFEYVTFENLGAPVMEDTGWELMGSVNFYESNVAIKNSVFKNNLSGDDSLNIIRSRFEISDSLFLNSFADAFDADFGEGVLSNCEFINAGNDGIDISGTKLKIWKVLLTDIGDKGISVGEKSNLEAKDLEILRANIGLASKDGSQAVVENIKISKTNRAFVALQKKPEYSPGALIVHNAEIANDVGIIHEVELGSSLILNGEPITGKHENLRDELY